MRRCEIVSSLLILVRYQPARSFISSEKDDLFVGITAPLEFAVMAK